MTQADSLPDLFAPPPEDAARPVGFIDGPRGWWEGFGAGLRCWCGPAIGWRDLGEVLQPEGGHALIHQHNRLTAGISFDLGEHRFPRRKVEEEQDG
jgi:hypothetical protein